MWRDEYRTTRHTCIEQIEQTRPRPSSLRDSQSLATIDIYAQFAPESQRRALAKISAIVESQSPSP